MTDFAENCRPRLNPRQEAGAVAVATGASYEAAGQTCGVSPRTVRSWMTMSHFRQRVQDLRSEMSAEALGQFMSNLGAAVKTLLELCKDGQQMVRLAAARSIVDYSLRLRESLELVERVSRLEESQVGRTRRRSG
jgi:hypothetical protein